MFECAHNGLKIALPSRRKETMKSKKNEISFSKTCQLWIWLNTVCAGVYKGRMMKSTNGMKGQTVAGKGQREGGEERDGKREGVSERSEGKERWLDIDTDK